MCRAGLFCYPTLANLPRARWWLQLLRDTHSSPTLFCSVPNKRTTTKPLPAVPWEWGQSGKFTSDSLSPKGLTLRISIYDRSIFFSMIILRNLLGLLVCCCFLFGALCHYNQSKFTYLSNAFKAKVTSQLCLPPAGPLESDLLIPQLSCHFFDAVKHNF